MGSAAGNPRDRGAIVPVLPVVATAGGLDQAGREPTRNPRHPAMDD
jgi:hypothetical protein